MNYNEAIEKIDSLLVFGSRLGLERIKKLLDIMGNPQYKLKFVHIAGTNGKGSVSNMTASVLTQAGYKTGLFTSPHITGFGERMQIDFCRISEEELIEQVEKLFPIVEQLKNDDIIITEFEFVTAIAFNWFAEKNCDVVVLETGMGGRFDSTNVIKTPLCSIITSVSLDHTAVLGDTLAKIAFEKAGIIKQDGNTVFAFQEDEVNNVIVGAVYERNNTLFTPANITVLNSDINGTDVKYGDLDIHIPLVGEHQISNLKLVLCAVQALQKSGLNINDSHIANGISNVKIPARFEVLKREPLIIIDGAHNPGGLKALSCAVDKYLSDKKIVCVMGMLKDKDCKNSLSYLKGKLYRLITTTVQDNPRRQTAEELKETAEAYFENIIAEEDFEKAVDLAVDTAEKIENSALLVCGSLYLASDIRNYLLKKDGI